MQTKYGGLTVGQWSSRFPKLTGTWNSKWFHICNRKFSNEDFVRFQYSWVTWNGIKTKNGFWKLVVCQLAGFVNLRRLFFTWKKNKNVSWPKMRLQWEIRWPPGVALGCHPVSSSNSLGCFVDFSLRDLTTIIEMNELSICNIIFCCRRLFTFMQATNYDPKFGCSQWPFVKFESIQASDIGRFTDRSTKCKYHSQIEVIYGKLNTLSDVFVNLFWLQREKRHEIFPLNHMLSCMETHETRWYHMGEIKE